MKAPETLRTVNLSTEDEAYWREHANLYKSSEQSRANYCRVNKVNYDRFGYWLKKFSNETLSLIPIKLKQEINTAPSTSQTLHCILNLRGGHTLQINDQKTLLLILEKLA